MRAVIGAAAAIGALKMLQKDEYKTKTQHHLRDHPEARRNEFVVLNEDHLKHSDSGSQSQHQVETPKPKHKHHAARLIQDTAGTYRLRQNIVGNNHHGIVLVIAEAVGALGISGLEDWLLVGHL